MDDSSVFVIFFERGADMRIYSLLDTKLKEFGGLVLGANDEIVKRALREGVPVGSSLEKYPEDFNLYVVGDFDATTGVLSPIQPQLVDNVKVILYPSS